MDNNNAPKKPQGLPEPEKKLENAEAPKPPAPEQLSEEPEVEPEPAGPTLPIGMKIDDRYEVMGVLGVGGFATVYRAHHLTIDRDVALKVMDIKKGVDQSYSQRFFREAKIAAKIHHNNVVSIYDFGHVAETGQPYIAMEMLHGHDLSHELAKVGPLSPQRAFVLFRPVLEALGQGHRLGIVHKDLKPENLYLVDPGGQHELMKVLDFGVARINSSEVAKLTSAGQLLGTPRYLAPEYIKTQNVSPAIDVYQMALIISEALTGTPAVTGDPFHAMMLHCSGNIQFAQFLLEGEVGEVFRKAISIDPEQRYPDCDAFGAALDGIADYFSSTVPLEGGAPQLTPDRRTTSDLSAMPLGIGVSNSSGDMSRNSLARVKADPEPPPKKNNGIFIVIFLLFFIIVGALVFIMVRQSKTPEAPVQPPVIVQPPTDEDRRFEFTYESEPSGASVYRGNKPICTPTPCKNVIMESDIGASQQIVFKLSGYEDGYFELRKTTYEEKNGVVKVSLKKKEEVVEAPKKIDVTLTYSPENAKVYNNDEVVCNSSPCNYVFNVDDGYVDFDIKLKDYKTETVKISQKTIKENNGKFDVKLSKKTAKPKPPTPTPAPAPTQKQKQKQNIMDGVL